MSWGVTLAAAAGILLILAAIVVLSCRWLQARRYTLAVPGLPEAFDGLRIAHLSDLHSARFGKNQARLARKVRGAAPDIVCFTGDMISAKDPDGEAFFELCRALEGLPRYGVWGNHEQRSVVLNRAACRRDLERLGVVWLDGERAWLERAGARLCLAGVLLPRAHYKHPDAPRLDPDGAALAALMGPKPAETTLLLTHSPLDLAGYADWGAEVALTGHMHGGMVRLPFLGGVLSPEKRLFPHFDGGLFRQGPCQMVNSRGLGLGTFPIRVFCRPEIAVVTLRRARAAGRSQR